MERSTVATFHAHVKAVPVDVKDALMEKFVECVPVVKDAPPQGIVYAPHLLEPSQAQPSPSSSTQIELAVDMDFWQWCAAQ